MKLNPGELSAIFRLSYKEILLPLMLCQRWCSKCFMNILRKLSWLQKCRWIRYQVLRRKHDQYQNDVNGANPAAGGVDLLFLAFIMFLLFTLLQSLGAVKVGLGDKMIEVLLGRVDAGDANKAMIPIAVSINDMNSNEAAADVQNLWQNGFHVFRYAPVDIARVVKSAGAGRAASVDGSFAIPQELIEGRAAEALEGRAVEPDDPIWQAAMRSAGPGYGEADPFIIVLNKAKFQSTHVDFEKMSKMISRRYAEEIATQWRNEVKVGQAVPITDLKTAWVRVLHYTTLSDKDSIEESKYPRKVPRRLESYELLPIKVVAVNISGMVAPDFLIPMDFWRMITTEEAPERLGPAPWRWFSPDDRRPLRRCHRLEVDLSSRDEVRSSIVDLDGKLLGWAEDKNLIFADTEGPNPSVASGLPGDFIERKLTRFGPGVYNCVPVAKMTDAEKAEWRETTTPPSRALVYLDWHKLSTLPAVLDTFRPSLAKARRDSGEQGTNAVPTVKWITVDATYQDTANRLMMLTTVLTAAAPWIMGVVFVVLFGFAFGSLWFIVDARRSRFTLLLTHGLSTFGLWLILAIQLTFTVSLCGVTSVFLARGISRGIDSWITSQLQETKAQNNLISDLSGAISLDSGAAVGICLFTLVVLLVMVRVILWRLKISHKRSLGKHLLTG
jgi:hypothetical protein